MRPLRALTSTAVALAAAVTLAACGGGEPEKNNPYNLLEPGKLRVATLTDAPPNVYLKDGKFTGFDNDLLRAVAAKLNLEVEFAGTDFSALLGQVANHRYDVGSSSITITEKRKQTVAFGNGYDFGHFGLDVPAGSPITGFGQLKGKRVVVVQGTVQDDYATAQGLNPVRVPDYNGALNQLKTGTSQAWISPAAIGESTAKDSGGKVKLVAKRLSPQPMAFAVAKDNPELLKALNTALDQVIEDGTWTKLQQQYFPGRPVPDAFEPGSGGLDYPAVEASPTTSPNPAS